MGTTSKILGAAGVALGTVGGIYLYFAKQDQPIEKIIGEVTARQVSASEWTLNCLACADVAKEICSDFSVVSEEIDFGSMWHTTIKCAS